MDASIASRPVIAATQRPRLDFRAFSYELPPHLLLYRGETRPVDSRFGYPAANEDDWWRAGVDHRPADVLIGIANNHLWETGVQRQARGLVLGDIDGAIPQIHEFLYRPLVQVARSRAEFLSMLAGVPTPALGPRASLSEIFDAIDRAREKLGRDAPERQAFIRSVEERVEAELGPRYAAFVSGHLRWVAIPAKERRGGSQADGPLKAYADWHRDDPYERFRWRYHPRRIKEVRAENPLTTRSEARAVERDPLASVMASEEAFGWLQGLFRDEQIRYFQADVFDPDLYRAIGDWARREGREVSGLSNSNVWAQCAQDPLRRACLTARNMMAVLEGVPRAPTFSIYRTTGGLLSTRHTYFRHDVSSARDVLEQLGIPPQLRAEPELSRSDFEIARDALASQAPSIEVAEDRAGVVVRLGDACDIVLKGARSLRAGTLAEFLAAEHRFTRRGDDLILPRRSERLALMRQVLSRLVLLQSAVPELGAFLEDAGVPPGTRLEDLPDVLGRADSLRTNHAPF